MEVTSPNVAMLSNYEVYNLIVEDPSKPRDSRKQRGLQNMRTIAYEAVRYMREKTTCTLQNQESIEAFLREVAHFNLTKAEKLQLLNLRPTLEVEIQLLIEEAVERLTEEQTQELLEIIRRVLPGGPDDDNNDNNDGATVDQAAEAEDQVAEAVDQAAEAGDPVNVVS